MSAPVRHVKIAVLLALGAVVAVLSVRSHAQSSGGSFSIPRASIDGGGGISMGAAYRLSGSVGQPDASSAQAMTGSSFALRGGLQRSAGSAPNPGDNVFANGFEN